MALGATACGTAAEHAAVTSVGQATFAVPTTSATHVPGGFPQIVFGHGFAVTPATYYLLLRAWARAGYVVAAPVFPKENAQAPGGPDESDLVNQPRDMSFVITCMLVAAVGRARRWRA